MQAFKKTMRVAAICCSGHIAVMPIKQRPLHRTRARTVSKITCELMQVIAAPKATISSKRKKGHDCRPNSKIRMVVCVCGGAGTSIFPSCLESRQLSALAHSGYCAVTRR